METLTSAGHSLYFESNLDALKTLLESNRYSKVFVFADEHTSEICLPLFQSLLNDFSEFDLIETAAGEENKNIEWWRKSKSGIGQNNYQQSKLFNA